MRGRVFVCVCVCVRAICTEAVSTDNTKMASGRVNKQDVTGVF